MAGMIMGKGMKIIRIAGYALLLVAVLAAPVPGVNGECTACLGGSVTAQQDALNSKWAMFMGDENAETPEVITSVNGLISPRYSRANNLRLQAENSGRASEDVNLNGSSSPGSSPSQGAAASNIKPWTEGGQERASVLVSLESANNSGIILDISPSSAEYIPGAISIPYTRFLGSGGVLLPVSEMARILGEAGVSETDALLIYGECEPCGGGPSAATYVYWIMKYLGHEDVKLLDGGIDDWVATRHPTVTKPTALSPVSYNPSIKADLLATYEYIQSNTSLIIDARTPAEFSAGSIPNAVNIPYDSVLDGKRIKDEAALQELFSSLQKDKPVAVYTNTGVKASMTWLALTLLGYDARIYSWHDWQASKPQLNIELQEVEVV
jgi:thiosulfate/3-mercaptopyruvate sulfurtransferase